MSISMFCLKCLSGKNLNYKLDPEKSVYVNTVVKSKLVRWSWQKASNLYVNDKVMQTHLDITSTK